MNKTIYTCSVKQEWVDYNGHLNDAEYARIFSLAVDALMADIGLNQQAVKEKAYSIFTLETHLCYLQEVNLDEQVKVEVQVLDRDAKRLHIFFTMVNEQGERVATSEQMLMSMDMAAHRPAPFPEEVATLIEDLAAPQENMEKPKEAGRTIGIRRK